MKVRMLREHRFALNGEVVGTLDSVLDVPQDFAEAVLFTIGAAEAVEEKAPAEKAEKPPTANRSRATRTPKESR